jgi:hypothetical protein
LKSRSAAAQRPETRYRSLPLRLPVGLNPQMIEQPKIKRKR